jgi:hypothetical protein
MRRRGAGSIASGDHSEIRRARSVRCCPVSKHEFSIGHDFLESTHKARYQNCSPYGRRFLCKYVCCSRQLGSWSDHFRRHVKARPEVGIHASFQMLQHC